MKEEGISKHFGGTRALKDVDFDLLHGEVHALIGQNGAGKSTFSRIVCGDLQRNSGKIYINGVEKDLKNSIEARREGISMVYQELRLIPYLSVTENILLNRYLKNDLRLLSWAKMHREVQDLMKRWDIKLNPKSIIGNLPLSTQQIVEILRNLYLNPKVLIMDEPTSALGHKEIQSLFNMINYIKKQGVAIVYISHVLDEVFTISDRITVFKDGKKRGTFFTKNFSINKAVQTMLAKKGIEINEKLKTKEINQYSTVLELKNIKRKNVLRNIKSPIK